MFNPAEYYVKLVSETTKTVSPSKASTSKTMDFPMIQISPTTNIPEFLMQNFERVKYKRQDREVDYAQEEIEKM